jgi:uncharacterized NAD(P)/FAD-binding protein YdhS
LIDRSKTFGRGVAYGTTDPKHLLNVPADQMGAGSTQKGRLYESVAVPELRGHAADLAAHLLNVVARSS